MWIDGYYVRTSREAIYYSYSPEENAAQTLGQQAGYYKDAPPMRVPVAQARKWTDGQDSYVQGYQAFITDYITKGYGDAEWNDFVSKTNSKYAWMFDLLNSQ